MVVKTFYQVVDYVFPREGFRSGRLQEEDAMTARRRHEDKGQHVAELAGAGSTCLRPCPCDDLFDDRHRNLRSA